MNRETLNDGTVVYSDDTGRAVLQRLAPGVLLLTSIGEFQVSFTNGPMQDFDREIAEHGSLAMYLNLLERKAVASSSRKPWTEWAAKNRNKIRVHVLMKSKLVGMAITVMAMLAGGLQLTTYSDVAELERAIARDVPSFRRLPPLPAKARVAGAR